MGLRGFYSNFKSFARIEETSLSEQTNELLHGAYRASRRPCSFSPATAERHLCCTCTRIRPPSCTEVNETGVRRRKVLAVDLSRDETGSGEVGIEKKIRINL